MTAITKKVPSWPVVEIFGPTIQGEGVDQGTVCHFVRLGGCDYRCVWCDTPHAVLPEEVRRARRMDAIQITGDLITLGKAPWIIISGGNPALHDLTDLIDKLHDVGYLVAVETQGSRWRNWMSQCDRVCVSPKPPSAEQTHRGVGDLHRFFEEHLHRWTIDDKMYQWMFFKVVIFNEEDLDFAEIIRAQTSNALLYLSAGNDAGRTVGQPERADTRDLAAVRGDLLDQTRWLTEEVFKRRSLCVENVIVQSQQHVALWGNELGR